MQIEFFKKKMIHNFQFYSSRELGLKNKYNIHSESFIRKFSSFSYNADRPH